MYSGFGRGRGAGAGSREGVGYRFRGTSPPWPYIGRGRGGLPRCTYFTENTAVSSPARGTSRITREEELSYLNNQAQTLKNDLELINSRVRDLESGK